MKVTFPAMRGYIGQRVYYSCMMQLGVIPKMFTFRDWVEFRPEDREQRVLVTKRVPGIAKYILDNEDGYLFSSITASYKCNVTFKPIEEDSDLGILEMDFDQANFVINDGQHRCAAIASAIKENPALAEETISVLLFNYESRERVQQMFSDLNRFVVKTSKSLNILYDKRDPVSQATLKLCELVPVFQGMVDKDAVSIGVRSPKLLSLSALYDATQELFRANAILHDEETSVSSLVQIGREFWQAVSDAMPDWRKVKSEHMRAVELRQESIASHAVVLRAIGAAGGELMKARPDDWKEQLLKLKTIDWRKQNRDWDGICIIANSVVSNRQARAATKAYIKCHLGLELSDAERRSLPTPEITKELQELLESNGSGEGGEARSQVVVG
ncbi:MAG: DNA sulfur modification protein DndB [Gammaproteobacteria bacterium]|nr:DNA sulfur modification protein DndB [Gammaproteobacteria bacterium]